MMLAASGTIDIDSTPQASTVSSAPEAIRL